MQLRWTDSAVRDFTHLCDYIEEHGGQSRARRVALSIYRQIDLLAKFPEHGRTGRRSDTRELVFSGLPYLAVYRIHKRCSGDRPHSSRGADVALEPNVPTSQWLW